MSGGQSKAFQWTDKREVSKVSAYAAGLGIAVLVALFKIRPYFVEQYAVNPFVHGNEATRTGKDSGLKHSEDNRIDGFERSGGQSNGRSRARGFGGGSSGSRAQSKAMIIDRPLFDGSSVLLKAAISQSLSSNQAGGPVEAKLIDGADLSAADERSTLVGATLVGTANANLETKRYLIQFNELITTDGKRYPVTAYAFDEATQTAGVPGDFSSGTVTRIAGAILGRAIEVGDTVGTGKILENTGTQSVASAQVNQAFLEANHEATNEISEQATQGLRTTKAELSLSAGTVFSLKLKASDGK